MNKTVARFTKQVFNYQWLNWSNTNSFGLLNEPVVVYFYQLENNKAFSYVS